MMQMNSVGSWESAREKPASWVKRHKQLAIPLGCLGVFLVGTSTLAATLVAITSAAMRSLDAYQLALNAAMHDPSVAAELGPPVQAGWFTTGHVAVSGSSGDATLAIPISGSRRAGTLNVSAQKSGGRWTFSVLDVSISGRSKPIDLLPTRP